MHVIGHWGICEYLEGHPSVGFCERENNKN